MVRPAVGRFDDFGEVVGVRKPGGLGCWCMSYRDSRISGPDRPAFMEETPGRWSAPDSDGAG
ncbi:hypothetical protein LTH96_00975 [Nesterenkonia sp. LB17]|nr:hypothetical protein [Nesterenkonia sp. LB17]